MNGLESPIFQPDTPGSHTRNPPETTTPNQIITLSVDLVYPLLATLMAWLKALKAPWVAPLEVQEASPVAHLSSFQGPVGLPSGPLSTLEASWAR